MFRFSRVLRPFSAVSRGRRRSLPAIQGNTEPAPWRISPPGRPAPSPLPQRALTRSFPFLRTRSACPAILPPRRPRNRTPPGCPLGSLLPRRVTAVRPKQAGRPWLTAHLSLPPARERPTLAPNHPVGQCGPFRRHARTCLLTELRSLFSQFRGRVAGLVGRVAGHGRAGGAGRGCGWLGGGFCGPAGSYRGAVGAVPAG